MKSFTEITSEMEEERAVRKEITVILAVMALAAAVVAIGLFYVY